MDRLRCAIVGCGDFAPYFAPYVIRHAELVAICDPNPAGRERCLGMLGLDLPQFESHQSLLSGCELDAVVITSANYTHAPIAIAAAIAGKHVFCEKAMATTTAECWAMVRAAQAAGVKLAVGHKRRLRPPWARMIELSRTILGPPLAIQIPGFYDGGVYKLQGTWWAKKEKSGGIFDIAGVHSIDWMRAAAGNIVKAIAIAGPRRDLSYDFPDITAATYVFESGAVGTIQVALDWPLHKFRESFGPQVVCERGAMRMVPTPAFIDIFWKKDGEDEIHQDHFDDLGFDHAYNLEFGDFVRWVTEGRRPCLTWEEGLRCVEAMEAACRSADSGGTPVSLPLHPELEPGEKIEL